MGKAQSKRSVDITTEGKKGPEEEVTGKLEKIEDIDQKQVNGDATPQENNDAGEKKDADESENDKDLTTEKSAETGGDAGDQNTSSTAGESSSASTSPKDESAEPTAAAAAAKDGPAAVEEISPLADDSTKKPKKEKLKKKWSFRSISFGKKDKQKPAKTEETAAETAAPPATNGNADDKAATGEVIGDADASKQGEGAAGDAEGKSLGESVENGVAAENGTKTPTSTPTEEEQKKPAEDVATNGTTTAAVATTAVAAVAEVSSSSVSNGTANETQTDADKEPAVVVAAAAVAVVESAPLSNGADTEASATVEKNGVEMPTVVDEIVKEAAAAVETGTLAAHHGDIAVEKIKTIASLVMDGGCDGDKPHQNGTSDDGERETHGGGIELAKSQIEVITNTEEDSLANTTTIINQSTQSIQKSIPNDPLPSEQSNAAHPKSNANEQTDDRHDRVNDEPLKADETVPSLVTCETPPPLPVSPPPSQVAVFAFNAADDNSEDRAAVVNATETMNEGDGAVATAEQRAEDVGVEQDALTAASDSLVEALAKLEVEQHELPELETDDEDEPAVAVIGAEQTDKDHDCGVDNNEEPAVEQVAADTTKEQPVLPTAAYEDEIAGNVTFDVLMNPMSLGEFVDMEMEMAPATLLPQPIRMDDHEDDNNDENDDEEHAKGKQHEYEEKDNKVVDVDVDEKCSLLTLIEHEIVQLSLNDNSITLTETINDADATNANTEMDRDHDKKNDNDNEHYQQQHLLDQHSYEQKHAPRTHSDERAAANECDDNAPPSPSHELISSSKEIANLKENNGAAEITTQDLPVTCE